MSGMEASSRSSQRRPPLRGEHADGRRPDAEDLGGLFRAISEDLREDERRSLPRWKAEQHPTDVLLKIDVVVGIVALGDGDQASCGDPRASDPHPEAV